MTQLELEQIVEKWQPRLKLQDWDITAVFVPVNELDTNADANVRYDLNHSAALIRILKPEHVELSGPRLHDYDPEYSVLHELVHLRLADISSSEESGYLEERAVNAITRALLDLDQGQEALIGKLITIKEKR